ncbi:S9 family peptidase [Brumimicrobium salinarum]|uniref:S9 family peptidase n=1 Tax=Brumimicrobium salinarum TaxID=2058658 RepID=A0A2I0R193_9FLAO|nr:S9 family peptidase [Brumimicrobium salinarum]PKR80361.1 S9 family peptidase [Brumimicrobium salinarum]
MKNTLLIYLFIFSTGILLANPQDSLNVEHIWKKYQFFSKGVDGFRSMKDGEHFTRFENINGRKSIIKYAFKDLEAEGKVIIDASDLVYKGKKLNIDGYSFNDDETKILLTVDRKKRYRRSFSAEYFLFDLKERALTPLDPERKPQTLATYSPDGKKIAYIHKNNLYVKEIASNKIIAITKDGKRNEIINGTTDWVYEEEFALVKAFDWSPNSEFLAFLRFDESKVKEFTMMYYYDLYPSPYTFKYPKTGEDNSKVTLNIATINTNKIEKVDLGDYEYIPRIKFSSTANKLLALTLNRHQNHLKYHWIDAERKKKSNPVIYEEIDDAYVEIDDNLHFLSDGKHFMRTSEKDGYNHIYKIGVDGSSQQITSGAWDVINFKGVDEEKGLIYYTSAEEGAAFKSLYSIQLDGSQKVKISDNKGQNKVTFAKGMKYYVNNWSNINTPNKYTLHQSDGKLIKTLERNDLLNDRLKTFNFQPKKFISIQGADKPLNAWILYPPNFDSTKQYPVYLHVYGGPGSNMVKDEYNGGNGAYHQLLAKHGYIVMSVDPRGTMYRGAKFKKSTYLQLGKLETEDLIAVAKTIGKWKFVDASRIGIMGWSYGGYMASLALTKGADYFKMGIAVAPVTNWRYYDNIYTERFMRTPQENPLGYDDNSPIYHVDKLKGNYFIIHGSGDDNVHVQNAMEMVNALVAADKDFTQFIYPNKDHGIYGGNTRNHLYRMMLNFTLKNL